MGQVLPLIVAFFALPLTVRGLGPDRFGILSISWVVLGYFSLFDFGVSRATTKFVAEALGRNEHDRIPAILWTSLGIHFVLGGLGGLLLLGLGPTIQSHILRVPPYLQSETTVTLKLMAAAVPVVVLGAAMRGALEGGQRFRAVNAVRVPTAALTYAVPAVGPYLGWTLTQIIPVMLLSRVIAGLAYWALCVRFVPALTRRFVIRRAEIGPLITFGGWVSISNTTGPFLLYFDRFLIGALLSMAAVAYYVAPYEAVTKLWIIPTSLATTVLPVFSALNTSNPAAAQRVFSAGVRFTLIPIALIVMVVVTLAREILVAWLGRPYADASTLVLQLLAIGILVNSLAYVPWSFLQAKGRPDLTSKFHLAQALPYVGLAWLLVRHFGIAGAAAAWAVRALADGLFHLWAAGRLGAWPRGGSGVGNLREAFVIVAAPMASLFFVATASHNVFVKCVILAVCLTGLGLWSWKNGLDNRDRAILMSLFRLDRRTSNVSS